MRTDHFWGTIRLSVCYICVHGANCTRAVLSLTLNPLEQLNRFSLFSFFVHGSIPITAKMSVSCGGGGAMFLTHYYLAITMRLKLHLFLHQKLEFPNVLGGAANASAFISLSPSLSGWLMAALRKVRLIPSPTEYTGPALLKRLHRRISQNRIIFPSKSRLHWRNTKTAEFYN